MLSNGDTIHETTIYLEKNPDEHHESMELL